MTNEHEKLPSGKAALLPCPFCGSKGEIDALGDGMMYAFCTNRESCGIYFNITHGEKENAARAWNTRVRDK